MQRTLAAWPGTTKQGHRRLDTTGIGDDDLVVARDEDRLAAGVQVETVERDANRDERRGGDGPGTDSGSLVCRQGDDDLDLVVEQDEGLDLAVARDEEGRAGDVQEGPAEMLPIRDKRRGDDGPGTGSGSGAGSGFILPSRGFSGVDRQWEGKDCFRSDEKLSSTKASLLSFMVSFTTA